MKVTKYLSLSLHLVFPKFECNRRRSEVATQRNAALPIRANAMRRNTEAGRWQMIGMAQATLQSTKIGDRPRHHRLFGIVITIPGDD